MASSIDLENALLRRNPHPNALGNIRRWRVLGMTLYVSPDVCVWLVPTGITIALAMGTYAMTHDVSPLWEKVGCFGLALIAFAASLACGMTDPGIYPRLMQGEADPLEGAGHGFTLCRMCNIRRPPRTAHCYICGVCVLEHDHHCGVIGGCVGMRSLRWFTLYLVCISSAALWGLFWLVMDVTGMRPHPDPDAAALASASLEGAARASSEGYGTTVLPAARGVAVADEVRRQVELRRAMDRQRGLSNARNRRNSHSAESISTAIDIMLIVFLVNIVLVVGGLAIYYVYLMCKDTTRREAQGKAVRPSGPSTGLLGTLRRTMFPPPSMLEMPAHDAGLGTASRNQGGII